MLETPRPPAERSVFSERPPTDWLASNHLAFALADGFPVSRGHSLIIPKREIASWFEATLAEQQALMELLSIVRGRLDLEFRPDGYNIGINDGPAAGQTVPHLHIHLIPRYQGDRSDPRGGVRWVLPERAAYWRPTP